MTLSNIVKFSYFSKLATPWFKDSNNPRGLLAVLPGGSHIHLFKLMILVFTFMSLHNMQF